MATVFLPRVPRGARPLVTGAFLSRISPAASGSGGGLRRVAAAEIRRQSRHRRGLANLGPPGVSRSGVPVSPLRHKASADWQGDFAPGVDPRRRSYASFLDFADSDGNTWTVQEIR